MKSIIQSLSSRASLTLRLALILLLVAVGASAQEVFRLTGKVTDKDTKEPLLGVSIVDSTTLPSPIWTAVLPWMFTLAASSASVWSASRARW